MPLHPDFQPATWRGTTNTDGKVIGVSFDRLDGQVVRLALDLRSARHLAESVLEFLRDYEERTNRQSERSSGSPNCDGSPHEGQSQ